MANWSVSNIVARINLNVRLPLDKIAMNVDGAEYDPEQFPGLILRLGENMPTTLLFNSGKIIISGAKDLDDVKRAINKIRDILKNIGINSPEKFDMKFENYVIQGSFDYNSINILRMAEELEDANYNPEQFPGVIVKYKKEDELATFLVYKNGKFVCTGLKNLEKAGEIIEAFEKEVISKYSKAEKK